MGFILERAQQALDQNPPAGDQFLTTNGSNWNYTVTAIFTVAFVSSPIERSCPLSLTVCPSSPCSA